MAPVASFHLARIGGPRLAALARVPADRRDLAGAEGLVLGRHLGTARGSSTALAADLSRWAVFAVWTDEAALERWERRSPLLARWRAGAAELWSVRLAPLTAHGRWAGVAPFPDLAGAVPDDGGGPVVVLARARVRLSRTVRFYRSAAAVDPVVTSSPGRLRSVGFGEWPLGWQGTLSLWRSSAAMTAFAYRDPEHRAVMTRTRAERWYGEELFARFSPYRSIGRWDGADPLAPA